MPDREKVKERLGYLVDFGKEKNLYTVAEIAQDALALLKEQEPMEPITDKWRNYICPVCGDRLRGGKFCMNCGQAVKWE